MPVPMPMPPSANRGVPLPPSAGVPAPAALPTLAPELPETVDGPPGTQDAAQDAPQAKWLVEGGAQGASQSVEPGDGGGAIEGATSPPTGPAGPAL